MNRLGSIDKISYSVGSFAWAAKDTCFHYFLFFYYTQLQGLSASLAGLAALLALVIDAISDPIIGHVSDNFKTGKWGRRHPFMIISVVPFCGALIAIFNPPAELSQTGLFFWYLLMAVAVRSFLTLFTVPHMALGAELSQDYTERTSIAVYRNILGYAGGVSIQVSAWFLIIPIATAAGSVVDGYRNVGFYAAFLAMIGMVVSIWGTRPHIPNLVQTSKLQRSQHWFHAFGEIAGLFRNPSARILLIGNLVIVSTIGLGNTLLLHMNNFFYGFSENQIGIFMMAVLLALLPASWLSLRGTQLFGKPRALVYMILGMVVIGPIPVLAHLYGLTPAIGSTGLLLVVCFFIVIHQSFYISYMNLSSGMVPDVADELQISSGRRQEGILNSALMLTQKVTFGVGTFLAGLTIDFANFEGVVSIADVTPDMSARLAWVYGPGLSCIGLLGAFIFIHYRLDQKRYVDIRTQLDG